MFFWSEAAEDAERLVAVVRVWGVHARKSPRREITKNVTDQSVRCKKKQRIAEAGCNRKAKTKAGKASVPYTADTRVSHSHRDQKFERKHIAEMHKPGHH